MMLQVDYFKFSFFFSISNPIVIVQYINISISIIKNFYEFFALHSLMNEKGYLTKIDCPGSIAVTAIKNGKTVPSTDKWMNQYKHFKLPLKTLKRRFQKKTWRDIFTWLYLTQFFLISCILMAISLETNAVKSNSAKNKNKIRNSVDQIQCKRPNSTYDFHYINW